MRATRAPRGPAVSEMSITVVRDGNREQQVTDETTTGLDLFGDDRTVVAARVNGELRDLHLQLPDGASSSRS